MRGSPWWHERELRVFLVSLFGFDVGRSKVVPAGSFRGELRSVTAVKSMLWFPVATRMKQAKGRGARWRWSGIPGLALG